MEPELVGLFEVAEMARVSRTVVSNWRARDPAFPSPVADLKSGPVFNAEQVQRYLKRRKKGSMAHVISTINLKGGVGKTTITMALAEILSGEFRKSVLVVDLDPQTNLTTAMIGEKAWLKLNAAGHTLATLFEDALRPAHEPAEFDLDLTRQRNASSVSDVRRLDLLPGSLDLIAVQDRLGTMSSGRFHSATPTALLRRAISPIIDEYDYVLIDCPPNLGLVTLNGLRMSDGYIIPTIPDVMSTYGIDQIQRHIAEFAEDIDQTIDELGIIVSKYQANSTVHVNTVNRLRRKKGYPPVFSTVIPQSNAIAEAADSVGRGTLRQKWGYQGQFNALHDLAKEFKAAVEAA